MLQHGPDRPDAMGTGRLAGAQLRDHEVQQTAADGVLWTGRSQDVVV
jgi:hypothetical protein